MATKRKWTSEEEQVLIDQVRINPSNLSRAFRATSDVIGRSPHSCEQRWYGKVRYSETVFMTIGAKNMNVNSKNSDNTQPVRLPIWRRILKLLGL
jgi:hypothetical protein